MSRRLLQAQSLNKKTVFNSMLFTFLQYLQPTHYFQLFRKDGTSIFPVVSALSQKVQQQVQTDTQFTSALAAEYDRSWRAIRKGYIGTAQTYTSFKKLPLKDEYYFVGKYFHPAWVLYVLVLRIIFLKNPLKEYKAWKAGKGKGKRMALYDPIIYQEWENYRSGLIAGEPLVTVVIPTLNRYGHLKNILQDFEKQSYRNSEVIVVDQSEPFNKEFYEQFDLTLNVLVQKEKALWLARNRAIENARGGIIALSEDDVLIGPDWLKLHLLCLDFFNADISAGVFYPEGSKIPEDRSFFSVASQFATGNAVLFKRIFFKTGLFDRQFERQRMGDGDFGLRAFLHGFKSISNPFAYCIDVKARSGGLRELGSWDAFRPKSFLSPRPIPSVLYFYRKYFGSKRSFLALLKTVPPAIIPYRYKKSRLFMVIGSLISLILLPVVLLQVIISWRKAGRKLKYGAIINELK